MSYAFPHTDKRPAHSARTIYLSPSGDLREAANAASWPVQVELERIVNEAVSREGYQTQRVFDVPEGANHGFIKSQRMGMDVLRTIPEDAPLIVAMANWQYSNHVLPGLRSHKGPILTVGNFEPSWPGLVGMLGLNGSLTKAGIAYSTLWTIDGSDHFFLDGLRTWLREGKLAHDASHVRPLPQLDGDRDEVALGRAIAQHLTDVKAIIGIFDEGCMGMYNAIIDDELLNAIGIYKERLSQSELWAQMNNVTDAEAEAVGSWLRDAGMTFRLGTDPATELTADQLLWQYKMYIAALRISEDFQLDAVGIQYQQGMRNLSPASDLVEGLLNNAARPPVTSADGTHILWEGAPLPCFNEVDEGVAVDALITNRVWSAMGLDPATTLHDVRWGDYWEDEFVWVLEISGSVPASHLADGYRSAEGWRQGHVFFPAGGATLKGVSRPGEVVWSRVYIEHGALNVDIGRGSALKLPEDEVRRRSESTTPEWPLANVVFHGVSRDQFMGRHKANHVQLVYAPDAATADRALLAKAAVFDALGVKVHLCGDVAI